MAHIHHYKYCVIFALVLITGLGFAFVLPILASLQSHAAQSEVDGQDRLMILHVHREGNWASPAESAHIAPGMENAPEVSK